MSAPIHGPGRAVRTSLGMQTPEPSVTSSHPPQTPLSVQASTAHTSLPPTFHSQSPHFHMSRTSTPRDSQTPFPQSPLVHHSPRPSQPPTKMEHHSSFVESVEDDAVSHGLPRTPSEMPSEHPSSHDGIQLMGRHVQMLQEVISNLEKLGVDKIDIPLPKLVVVGDQSAGKSSVIGGLAEIDLPRSSGTCTRCPYYIRTKGDSSDGATWSCRISIQKRFEFVDLPRRFAKKDYPLGPWRELRQTDEVHFATTKNKDDLHDLIVRAQKAVLNPRQEPGLYLQSPNNMFVPPSAHDEAQFSPNLVSLEISGPDLPSLSFYDLPGIIQTADEEHLVKVVETLAKNYIGKEDAIILCALPMSGDPANSTAVRFIREANALNRCIGVLTKPDLLQNGELDNVWLPILRGDKDGLRAAYGWYVTKQPGPNDAHLNTHELIRNSERDFFNTQRPWCGELSDFNARFGADGLRNVVSETLTRQITKALPLIKSSIQNREKLIQDELARLPAPPPADVFERVLKLLSTFSDDVIHSIEATGRKLEFVPQWGRLYKGFSEFISEQYPRVGLGGDLPPKPSASDPSEGSRTPRSSVPRETVEISSDESDGDDLPLASTPSKRRNGNGGAMPAPQTPVKRIKADVAMNGSRAGTPSSSFSSQVTAPFSPGARPINHTTLHLQYIRQKIEDLKVTPLPGIVNPDVNVVLILESIQVWESSLKLFVSRVVRLLGSLLTNAFERIFASHKQTPLFVRCKGFIDELLGEFETEVKRVTDTIHKKMTKKVFTANEKFFNEKKQAHYELLKAARRRFRTIRYIEIEEFNNKKSTTGKARIDKISKTSDSEVDEKFGKDQFEEEIKVASWVRGYYSVLAVRFVDNICYEIDSEFFDHVKETVRNYLEKKLGLYDGQGRTICKNLMEPNPDVARRRAALEFEQAQLKEASKNLERVVREVGDVDGRPFLENGNDFAEGDEEEEMDYI